MKKWILFLTLLTVPAHASSTRITEADSLISSDHTKTYAFPAGTTVTFADTAASQTLTNKTMSTGSVWSGTTIATTAGGTGQTTYTDGQLLIGDSSNSSLDKSTLTAGTGITITNGNGSITIAASGGGSSTTSTEWASYTSTVSGLGTITNKTFRWRRVGDSMDIEGFFHMTGTSGTVSFTIPATFNIDSGKLTVTADTSSPGMAVGGWYNSNFTAFASAIVAITTSSTLIYTDAGSSNFIPQNGAAFASNSNVQVRVTIPISGWTNSN